ncbi:MAG: ATP-binding protein [Planctomycetota bacterium]
MPDAALFLGIALGVAASIPLAWLFTRRVANKVRRLEQRAQTAERLAEVGNMTSGLAHEIKNPLSTLGLNLQLLQEDLTDLKPHLTDDADGSDKLARIDRRFGMLGRETARLREILEDFLRYAGRIQLDQQPTDLNALAADLIDFFEPQAAAAGVRLRGQFDANPAVTSLDPALIKQAVLNLMINAVQAMQQARDDNQPHGGANELLLHTHLRSPNKQPELHLHVTDTGPGIPPDRVDTVFQPYISHKRGGTGLGLPTTRRLIEEHGGRLELHNAPGRGCDFILAFPIDPLAPDA